MHVLLLAGATLALPLQDVEDGRGDRLVKVELLSDRGTVRAGEKFALAVSFQVDPGWHIYWQNPGDSGFPTTAEIRGPEGFEIGPLRYPAPERVDLEGDIVEYVHTGEVVLLADVRAPAKLSPGTSLRFEVECRWLVCTEVCYAGSGKSEVALTVAEPRREPRLANEKLFAGARARTPRPWKDLAGATLSWSRTDECTILAITVQDATELEFYPLASGTVSLRSRSRAKDERMSRLTLLFRFEPRSPDGEPIVEPKVEPMVEPIVEPMVHGVLRVRTKTGDSCYDLEVPFGQPEPLPPTGK